MSKFQEYFEVAKDNHHNQLKMEVYLTENLGRTSRFDIQKETYKGFDIYSWKVKTKKTPTSEMVPKYEAWVDDGEPMGNDPISYESREIALHKARKYMDER